MNKFKKTFLSVAIALSALSATFVNASDGEGVASTNGKIITADDKAFIDSKKDALIYMLYEREQLAPLLKALKENERSKKKEEGLQERYPYSVNELLSERKLEQEKDKGLNMPINDLKIVISEDDYQPDSRDPIIVRVAKSNASSLAFFDYQGNPWPIEGDVIGNNTAFKSYPFTENKNVAIFEIQERFAETVALIQLMSLNYPLVIKLVGSESEIDARKNIRIPLLGPQSNETIIYESNQTTSSNPLLVKLLNGEIIKEATYYSSSWDDNTLYARIDNKLYIRTKNEVVFPIPADQQESSNGYHLYEINFRNNITMVINGETRIVSIEEAL